MHDQPIHLDASFDQRASYVLVAWLRPRDAYVNIGESIAIIQDGDMRRVVTAPCSGRIVAVYADAGARLLPRSLLAVVRPGLPYAPHMRGLSTTIVAIALIGATIVLVPLLRGMIQLTRSQTPIAAQPTPIPTPAVAGLDAPTPPPSDIAPVPTDVPAEAPVVATTEPVIGTPSPLAQQVHLLVRELVNLGEEIRPWTQRNALMNTQITDVMIIPRNDRRSMIINELNNIVSSNDPALLHPKEAELLGLIESIVQPCNVLFDEAMSAHAQSIIPRDLSGEYEQCSAALTVTEQYLVLP